MAGAAGRVVATALREGVAATLATRSTRATTMLTKTMDRLSMLHMLSMLMGMLPAKEAMGMLHTTNTDGKSTHDAHEDDSETCGAPLDAGACFCSNLLDFVSLHDSIYIEHSCRDTEDAPCPRTRTPARSHTPPRARVHAAQRCAALLPPPACGSTRQRVLESRCGQVLSRACTARSTRSDAPL